MPAQLEQEIVVLGRRKTGITKTILRRLNHFDDVSVHNLIPTPWRKSITDVLGKASLGERKSTGIMCPD